MWAGGSDKELNKAEQKYQIDFYLKPSPTCGLPSEISGRVYSRQSVAFAFNLCRYVIGYLILSLASIVITRKETLRFSHLAMNYDMDP